MYIATVVPACVQDVCCADTTRNDIKEFALVPPDLDLAVGDLVIVGERVMLVCSMEEVQKNLLKEDSLVVLGRVNTEPYQNWEKTNALRKKLKAEIQRQVSQAQWISMAKLLANQNPQLASLIAEYENLC